MTTQDLKDNRSEIIETINSKGLSVFTKEIMLDMVSSLNNPYIESKNVIDLLDEVIDLFDYNKKLTDLVSVKNQEFFTQQMKNQMRVSL